MKRVEILLAAYQGHRYLRPLLDSILAQDTDCWHLTVSDDGSQDSTPAILDEYARRYPDKITRVSGAPSGSAKAHFFRLMQECTADYMQFADQDDVWHPDKVRLLQEALEQAESTGGRGRPVLVFADQAVVDSELAPLAPSLMKLQHQDPGETDWRSILFRNMVTGCTMGINRPMAELACRCVSPGGIMMHDWWLALAAAGFGRLVYVDRPLIDYRQHSGNVVGAKGVGGLPYIMDKLSHFDALRRAAAGKKQQAAVFLETYRSALSEEDVRLLTEFASPRSALSFKLSYLPRIADPVMKLGFLATW